MIDTFSRTVRRAGFATALVAIFAFPGTKTLVAQDSSAPVTVDEASLTLPDAPSSLDAANSLGVSSSAESEPVDGQNTSGTTKTSVTAVTRTRPANPYEMYLDYDQVIPTLTVKNKVLAGLKDSVSLYSIAGWFGSAGWEQLWNSSPNYGTDSGAFGQRLGAAALRSSTEGIFSNSVMAPLLHEDARYFRLGPRRNFFVRAVYAGTRVIITKTDSGKTIPNIALLTGTLGGSALANTYNPPINRGTKEIFITYGGSLGGTAVAFLISEFFEDVFHKGH